VSDDDEKLLRSIEFGAGETSWVEVDKDEERV